MLPPASSSDELFLLLQTPEDDHVSISSILVSNLLILDAMLSTGRVRHLSKAAFLMVAPRAEGDVHRISPDYISFTATYEHYV